MVSTHAPVPTSKATDEGEQPEQTLVQKQLGEGASTQVAGITVSVHATEAIVGKLMEENLRW